MAKLRSGLLGKTTGKVANIVTSTWKGINYAREKVIPSNPRSIAQTRVRDNMRNLVLIGRAVKTVFISSYWDTLVRGTANSGWAKFIGTNQTATQALQNLENVKLATGSLEGLPNILFVPSVVGNTIEVRWDDGRSSSGLETDKVIAYAFVPARNYMYQNVGNPTRVDETLLIGIPSLVDIVDFIYIYVTVVRADGSLYGTSQATKIKV